MGVNWQWVTHFIRVIALSLAVMLTSEVHTMNGQSIGEATGPVILDMAWSPDGSMLVASSFDFYGAGEYGNSKLLLINPVSQQTIRVLYQDPGLYSRLLEAVAWHWNGQEVFVADSLGTIDRYDITTGILLRTYQTSRGYTKSIDVHPTAEIMAVVSSSSLIDIIDLDTGAITTTIDLTGDIKERVIQWIAWSPNGNMLAALSLNNTILVFSAQSFNLVAEFSQEGSVSELNAAAWSWDSSKIAAGGNGRFVSVWDISTQQKILDTPNLRHQIQSIAWHPNDTQLSIALSQTRLNIMTYDMISTRLSSNTQTSFIHISHLAWSSQGQLAIGGDRYSSTSQLLDASNLIDLYDTLPR
jgi:WD40 repeat protein